MHKNRLMIYGAYGYTGQLMVEEALWKGIRPILAGRNERRVASVAAQYDLPFRTFNVSQTKDFLKDISVMLNCVGPFSATAEPVVAACLDTETHYLDITGEIEVFQKCYQKHEEAKKQNIILMPGVGFDIVPTDCIAAMLKQKSPCAERIDLAFSLGTKPSPGTTKTTIENAGKGGIIRENHQLVPVKHGYQSRKIPFQNGEQWATTIPWGDVFTSGISTGVPHGLVYAAMPKAMIRLLRLSNSIRSILNSPTAQNFMHQTAKILLGKNPGEEERKQQHAQLWGEATTPEGEKTTITLSGPNAYLMTAEAGIKIAQYCLKYDGPGGYFTPSMLLGADFIRSVSGVKVQVH